MPVILSLSLVSHCSYPIANNKFPARLQVLNKLACALNRRDEVPNQELAKKIAAANDKAAVRELVKNLSNKDKNIQSDCIKVIYEIAYLKPKLVSPHIDVLLKLLENKNNRLQWGAMSAIDAITNEIPGPVYKSLGKIIACADKGTVITNDHYVGILSTLGSHKEYAEDAFTLLIERLKICPVNQLPMYAEVTLPVINSKNKTAFTRTLTERLKDIEQEPKKKRIANVLTKVCKL